MTNLKIFLFITIIFYWGCNDSQSSQLSEEYYTTEYHKAIKRVTDIIVHDIFSPPVAARIYAYTSIAGYETAGIGDTSFISLEAKIKHFEAIGISKDYNKADIKIASIFACLNTARHFIFSEDSIQISIDELKYNLKKAGVSNKVVAESEKLAKEVSEQVIQWSKKDMYSQTRSYPKFAITNELGRWMPTPPGFKEAIEPAWNVIRPMLMQSADIFKPEPPSLFNVNDKNSQFYKEVTEVYEISKVLDEEQIEIANFWDCNPFALQVTGHVMLGIKKISPGGHWINITCLASKKRELDLASTSRAYALVSIGLYDAFISCWDEKYRSNLIRPESVINEYIDSEWRPILQTPPFPEYTSGHSVASTAASIILTKLFGDNFVFDDDTEVEFGLPIRSFKSFEHAAEEASISRLYGGIHYRPAIENGIIQGQKIGLMVVDQLLK